MDHFFATKRRQRKTRASQEKEKTTIRGSARKPSAFGIPRGSFARPLPAPVPVGFGARPAAFPECLLLFRWLIDFVEQAALVEMGILGLLPAAKDFIDGEESELGKHSAVFCGGLLVARAVKIPAGDVLAFVG